MRDGRLAQQEHLDEAVRRRVAAREHARVEAVGRHGGDGRAALDVDGLEPPGRLVLPRVVARELVEVLEVPLRGRVVREHAEARVLVEAQRAADVFDDDGRARRVRDGPMRALHDVAHGLAVDDGHLRERRRDVADDRAAPEEVGRDDGELQSGRIVVFLLVLGGAERLHAHREALLVHALGDEAQRALVVEGAGDGHEAQGQRLLAELRAPGRRHERPERICFLFRERNAQLHRAADDRGAIAGVDRHGRARIRVCRERDNAQKQPA